MKTDAQTRTARLMRVVRHPLVRTAAQCVVWCAVGTHTRPGTTRHGTSCCP